jgi:hypothetical protein
MPTITIDADELQEVVARLLPFRSAPDAGRPALAHLQVAQTPEGLRWTATDSYRMGCLLRGTSDLAEPVLVEAGLLDFAHRAASRNDVETVRFEVDVEDGTTTLDLPTLRVPRPIPPFEYPDVDHFLEEVPEHNPTLLQVSSEDLRGALHAVVTFTDHHRDGPSQPVALRSAGDGTLEVISHWPDGPDTHAFIPATSDGPVDAVVNASYLHDLIESSGAVDVTLFIGAPTDPMRVRTDDDFHALLMPIHLGQPALEHKIADFLDMERDDLYVTEDGWIPITTVDDNEIWVHLLDNADPFRRGAVVRFSAVLAQDVPASAELFAELNDLNRQAVHCRVLHVDDRVHVAAEYLLDTLDDAEIATVCRELDHQLSAFGPLFSVHRG